MPTDQINALFEFVAALCILNHCRVIFLHKEVRGVSVLSSAFFTFWGVWNLYFYPAVGQSWSFYAGLFVVMANAVYVAMLIFYNRKTQLIYFGTRGNGL